MKGLTKLYAFVCVYDLKIASNCDGITWVTIARKGDVFWSLVDKVPDGYNWKRVKELDKTVEVETQIVEGVPV